MKNLKIFYILIFINLGLQAQNISFSLKWNIDAIEKQVVADKIIPLFQKKNFLYDNENIYFSKVWKIASPIDTSSTKLSNISYSLVSASLINKLNIKNLPEDFKISIKNAYARDEVFAYLQINAFIKKNNRYYKLDAFNISYQHTFFNKNKQVQNIYDSEWATGDWYQFKIDKTGVYKITKNFLNELGLNLNGLDPRKIKIFGNGGKVLPLKNEVAYPEDITELAIEVIGEQDGVFNDDDYILFYAISHKEWSDDYESNLNFHTDETSYFIKIDGQNGKRVQAYQEPAGLVSDYYNNYLSKKFYEQDKVIFTYMGRKAFDEPLSLSNNIKTVSFKFDNLITSLPVNYSIRAAVNKAPVSLNISINNQYNTQLNFSNYGTYQIGKEAFKFESINVNGNEINFKLTFNNNNLFDAQLYLDYINISAFCSLKGTGKQFQFYHPDATGNGIGAYQFEQASDITRIWDITNPYEPTYFLNTQSNFEIKFDKSLQKNFIAIDKNDLYLPEKSETVNIPNQNLHREVFYHTGTFSDVDYLIITPDFLHNEAEKFADLHRANGLNVFVADLKKIYREFGNAQIDIAAIRNFIKYIYNNASSSNHRLKYVMMFGDASNDYKNLIPDYLLSNNQRTQIVPLYHSLNSFDLVNSIASDDFFVMMDDSEGLLVSNTEIPDIAIGRLVVRNQQDAQVLYRKYTNYTSDNSKQNWRNSITLWADDADPGNAWENQFTINTENIALNIKNTHPEINLVKIYQDAYQQINTPGGPRYPDAKRDLINQFEKGTLILAYIGHGNETTLSHEHLFVQNDVFNMNNFDRLPLMTTMTCEFGKFDNPTRETAAELLMWNNNGGVLEMVSTTRSMYSSNASNMNTDFFSALLGLDFGLNGQIIKKPAQALRVAKTFTSSGIGKFNIAFLGDPCFDLGFADPEIVLTSVNNQPIDTLKALKHIKIKGEIHDSNGNLMTNFNGTINPIVFDKYQNANTLDNDNNGLNINFEKLGRKIFQGKANISNGEFEFEFIVPKDINLSYGNGRISFYAYNQSNEKIGYNENIIVGGVDNNAPEDNTPPTIKAYMNDTNFVSGGITDEKPYLILELEDEHGINTIGGIGHDITAYLDDNQTEVFVLNDFYETEPNTYKKGKVKYRLYNLQPGWHTLTAKAWDVYNNSSTTVINFEVVSNDELKLDNVLNYPNPFVNYTEFWFNHNRPFENLDVQIQIYTISGKLVWQHRQNTVTSSYLSREITWDGRDNFGNKLAKGVYIYKLSVKTSNGKTAQKIEKLVIL